MQRHRKKDRTERAPPTIQKYLHGTAGSPIGSSAASPATNENLYQSCVGGNATKAAGLACCRKDDLMFHNAPTPGPGSYPEDDPDCIEVYKEQQKNDEQRHSAGSRTQDQPFSGKWCAPNVNQLAREVGNLHTPLGDALLHHHHHHQEQQQQQQQQLLSCHPNILSAGSAEYSYAYCEPMLLQRPVTAGDVNTAEQQQQQQQIHTPVSTLSSSGSSYCVPVYAQRQQLQHHAPSLPLLQRPFRQPSAIRHPYQYTYGNPAQGSADGGTNTTTTTTLHHHHHHHHHHSNYTLPNAATASNATTTTRTGSLRALFANIFRKSSVPSAGPSLASAAAAHSAPFLELDGGGPSLLGAERHSFTTCYGTKENIYEDIGSQTGLGALGASVPSDPSVAGCGGGSATAAAAAAAPPPPPPPPLPPSGAGSPTVPLVGSQDSSVAAERRRVQVQHDRIIGELNLSVERLIMPSCDDELVQARDQHARYQEYSELEVHDCKQMMMGQKAGYCLSDAGYEGANVAVGGGGGVGGMTGPSMGALRLSTKRHLPATTPAAGSSSSPPPTLGAGSERHSPTVSYGKSYGDVDSGISSSSTSGTSYSSSILYRSITNYPQQHQHQQQQQHQTAHHHHPQRTKHSLFNLHLGLPGGCRGPKDQLMASRAEGFVGLAGGSTNAVVTNAPDPPPPPDTSLLSYVCPTAGGTYGPLTRLPNTSVSSQTLTSCCFLSDHNLAERRDIGTRPFAATFAYNHHHSQQQQRGSSARASNGSGNFWARFRKLRLPTGTGGKLFSASQRHIDTELHLEDFTGESMWPEPGPRPVYHHPLHAGPPPPHQLALLPLDAHRMGPATCALPSTTPSLNGNLPPPPPPVSHQRTLHPFVAASEPAGPPTDGGDVDDDDGSELPQQRSCSPSTPSSVASTATSSGTSSSSSASPSSPMSPVSSSSGSSSGATKHSGGAERNVV
ncbi:uncharacterized protein LOC126562696 [Anopheles maculipalpis]|uniref:uncharacterized protein LOC126562696 n=1 Tax=Anopheles maculipalpis TaxID=1496333 RepID=UPI002158E205|nr:uncharacterized protein LOC126562696 [Anopheles maculipalpis]